MERTVFRVGMRSMSPSIECFYSFLRETARVWLLQLYFVSSVVEWLKRRTRDQHGLGSKLTRVILLFPWERHFTALSPAWWSWQAVLNYSDISIKLQADNNILASPDAGWGNCLYYALAPPSLSCKSGG